MSATQKEATQIRFVAQRREILAEVIEVEVLLRLLELHHFRFPMPSQRVKKLPVCRVVSGYNHLLVLIGICKSKNDKYIHAIIQVKSSISHDAWQDTPEMACILTEDVLLFLQNLENIP